MSFPQVGSKNQHNQRVPTLFPIYVTPLPQDVRYKLIKIKEQDLRFLFSLFGQITSVKILKKYPSQIYCSGFINFISFEAKQKAKKLCNGKMLGWKSLTVQDGNKNQSKDKKTEQNWQNQTFYEEICQKYQSKPKKKVQLTERKLNIDQSFGRMSIKSSSNSSRYHQPYQKSFSNHKFKEISDNFKLNPFPNKWNEKSRKGHSSCLTNRKEESKEIEDIDY